MRHATDQDILGGGEEAHRYGGGWIKRGVVGFAEDTSTTRAEKGDGTSGDTGTTLVHVTLFEGRDLTRRPEKGKAQGRRVKAQVGWPLSVVPPLGFQVIVAFPDGDLETPGNGVILTAIAPASTQQFDVDRAILDVGKDLRLTLKGQHVQLCDHGRDENPARFPCFITVGPAAPGEAHPGITIQDPTGTGLRIANAVVGAVATDGGSPPGLKATLELSASQFVIALNGAGFVRCDGATSNLTVGCSGVAYLVGKQCMLGPSATALTPVVVGPSGMAGAASTCVFATP